MFYFFNFVMYHEHLAEQTYHVVLLNAAKRTRFIGLYEFTLLLAHCIRKIKNLLRKPDLASNT